MQDHCRRCQSFRDSASLAKPVAPGLIRVHPAAMTRALVNAHAASLPGAEHSDPWGGGHDAWKVGGKLFCVIGARDDHGVDVKCPDVETARLLIEMNRAFKAPYFHASWVRIPFGHVADEELRDRLTNSYKVIRASLPKRLQAELAALP